MKKKQIIGLGTLLLVLLLGSFTTCYAYRYPLTSNDIMSVLMTYQGDSNSNSVTYRNNIINDFNYLNNKYDTITLSIYGSTNSFIIAGFNASDVTYTTNAKNINYMSAYINGTYEYFTGGRNGTWVSPSNKGPFSQSNREFGFGPGSQKNGKYLMYNNDLPGADGPWQSSNIINFVEPYTPIYFDYYDYPSTQYVDLTFIGDDGLTYNFSDIPLFYQPNYTSYVSIGYLNNPEFETLVEDRYSIIYYNNNKWNARTLDMRTLDKYATSSNFLSVQTDDLITYSYTQIPNYIVKDCFYFYAIDDSEYNRAIALWYIASSDTIVSGDRIDPTTFDNKDDYKKEINDLFDKLDNIDNIIAGTEPIVDTLTNDEDVSGDLAAFISGDADDLAAKFGYNPIENPFTTVVLDIIQQLTDVLLGSGNASIDLSNHGINWVINSRDIYLPPGHITTFIHLMCNAWFIWGIYKYGFQLYQWIQSGRLQNLVNETNRHQYFLF